MQNQLLIDWVLYLVAGCIGDRLLIESETDNRKPVTEFQS